MFQFLGNNKRPKMCRQASIWWSVWSWRTPHSQTIRPCKYRSISDDPNRRQPFAHCNGTMRRNFGERNRCIGQYFWRRTYFQHYTKYLWRLPSFASLIYRAFYFPGVVFHEIATHRLPFGFRLRRMQLDAMLNKANRDISASLQNGHIVYSQTLDGYSQFQTDLAAFIATLLQPTVATMMPFRNFFRNFRNFRRHCRIQLGGFWNWSDLLWFGNYTWPNKQLDFWRTKIEKKHNDFIDKIQKKMQHKYSWTT